MYETSFTKEQLDLIGECILETISQLNTAWNKMPLEAGRVAIQEQIVRCNAILVELAKVQEEDEA